MQETKSNDSSNKGKDKDKTGPSNKSNSYRLSLNRHDSLEIFQIFQLIGLRFYIRFLFVYDWVVEFLFFLRRGLLFRNFSHTNDS